MTAATAITISTTLKASASLRSGLNPTTAG
jgi:hypothetical protein